jgi:DNA-binding NarL/FixJ family response regulator
MSRGASRAGLRKTTPTLRPPSGLDTATLTLGEDYVVLSYPLPVPALPGGLTSAEGEVARLLFRGLSPEAVAVARAVSVRTIANQIRSLYAKLGISSRVEMMRVLSTKR